MNAPFATIAGTATGRRRESRLRVRLDARMITLDGRLRAVLADISGWGARIRAPELPLRRGQEAVLQWSGGEAFGVVVWVAPGQAGLSFYDPLSRHEVAQLRRMNDTEDRDADRREVRRQAQAFVQGKVRL